LDPRHHVAPHRPARAVALAAGLPPPVGDAGAAHEGDLSVDDQELAVRAVVQAREAVPAHPLIRLDAAPRLPERPRRPVERSEAADGVHHDRHAHARSRAIRERLDEAIADPAPLEDVALHVARLARAPTPADYDLT